MKTRQIIFLLASLIVAACNSTPRSEASTDSSMTDSATIGIDTNATDVDSPVPVSDSGNTGLGKVPGDKR